MVIAVLSLSALAFVVLQVLLGGTSPVLSIPGFGITALAGLSSGLVRRSFRMSRATRSCLLTSAVFCGYIAARALFSQEDYIARADLYLVLAALIIYFISALVIHSARTRVQFVTVLLTLATANVIIGGIQYFKGHNFMPFEFLPRYNYGWRASGFFGSPNHLAGFLEVVMLFGLSLACWGRYGILPRIAAGYVAAVCIAGILLTGSRGGYASSVAGLVIFGFVSLFLAGRRFRRGFWFALLASTLLVVIAAAFAVRSAVQRSDFLRFRVETANSDVGVRVALTGAAMQQFHLNPWFGTGSRTYLFFGRQFRGPSILADPTFAHNDYAQLLAEYGILGLGSFLIFLGAHLRSGWKCLAAGAVARAPVERRKHAAKRSDKGSRSRSAWRTVEDAEAKRLEQQQPAFKGSNSLALTAASLSSVAAYMVHSFVDFNLHIPANACLMAFVFGVLANPGAASPEGQTEQREPGRRWVPILRGMPVALGLWLLLAALPKWPGEYYGEKARRLLSDWRFLDSNEIAIAAVNMSRRGLKSDPRNPELFYYLGESQNTLALQANDPEERTRQYEASVSSYRSALELAPRDVRYVLCLAWALDALGRFDDAEPAFKRALALDPRAAKVHSSYAAHFQQQGKLIEAEAEYAVALALSNKGEDDMRLRAIRNEIQLKKTQSQPPAAPPP